MAPTLDVQRSAKLLIDRHGNEELGGAHDGSPNTAATFGLRELPNLQPCYDIART